MNIITDVEISCPMENISLKLIGETELWELTEQEVLKNVVINVIEQSDLTYRLIINTTWKEGDFCLGTTRKTPRKFASVDTLIAFLRKFGTIGTINLHLMNSEK